MILPKIINNANRKIIANSAANNTTVKRTIFFIEVLNATNIDHNEIGMTFTIQRNGDLKKFLSNALIITSYGNDIFLLVENTARRSRAYFSLNNNIVISKSNKNHQNYKYGTYVEIYLDYAFING